MKKVIVLMVVTTMLVIVSNSFGAFGPTNLAFNPDFEDDWTDWWTGGSSTVDILSTDNGPSLSGSHCLMMATPGSRDVRSQGIPVEVGKEYQLTFDYKTLAGASGNPQVRFRFWDGLGAGGTYGNFKGEAQRTLDLTNGDWATVDPLTYTAPEDAVAVDIVFTINVFGSFNGEVRFDNIVVLKELEVGQAVPVSPLPDEEGVLLTAQLAWQAPRDPSNPTDADPNTHSFVVYCDPNLVRLETATYDSHAGVPYFSDQLLVGDIVTDPIQYFDPVPDLTENTTYYWRVDTRNDDAVEPNDVFTGIILSFNTNLAPDNVVAISDIVLPTETDGVIAVTADDPPGTGLSYQWYLDLDPTGTGDEVALSDGADYSGTNTANLTIINPAAGYPTAGGDEGFYLCDVTNTSGTTRSNSARLTIGRLLNHYELDGDYTDSASGYDAVLAGLGKDPNWITGKVGTNALELYGDEGVFIDMEQAVTNYPAGTYPSSAQQLTVTAWVQTDVQFGWRTIAGNWGQGLFQLGINPEGQLAFEIAQPGGTFYVTDTELFPTTPGEWQFVAAVTDGSHARLYRMGASEAVTARHFEVSNREYDGNLQLNNFNAGIGCYTDDGVILQNPWDGKIDDVRIYNYGLSGEDVADIYGSSVCLYSDNPVDPLYLNGNLDLDDDCDIDLGDFSTLAGNWLDSGVYTP